MCKMANVTFYRVYEDAIAPGGLVKYAYRGTDPNHSDNRALRTAMQEHRPLAYFIGVKLRRWVAFHGIALNVEPDLNHFDGIVPCGVREHGVTSLVDLGLPVTMDEADEALRASFRQVFGEVASEAPPL